MLTCRLLGTANLLGPVLPLLELLPRPADSLQQSLLQAEVHSCSVICQLASINSAL